MSLTATDSAVALATRQQQQQQQLPPLCPNKIKDKAEQDRIEQLLSERVLQGCILLENSSCPQCHIPLVLQVPSNSSTCSSSSDKDDDGGGDDNKNKTSIANRSRSMMIPACGSAVSIGTGNSGGSKSTMSHSSMFSNNSNKVLEPVPGIPHCVNCQAHVISETNQVQQLLQSSNTNNYDWMFARKGAILVATPSQSEPPASPEGTNTADTTGALNGCGSGGSGGGIGSGVMGEDWMIELFEKASAVTTPSQQGGEIEIVARCGGGTTTTTTATRGGSSCSSRFPDLTVRATEETESVNNLAKPIVTAIMSHHQGDNNIKTPLSIPEDDEEKKEEAEDVTIDEPIVLMKTSSSSSSAASVSPPHRVQASDTTELIAEISLEDRQTNTEDEEQQQQKQANNLETTLTDEDRTDRSKQHVEQEQLDRKHRSFLQKLALDNDGSNNANGDVVDNILLGGEESSYEEIEVIHYDGYGSTTLADSDTDDDDTCEAVHMIDIMDVSDDDEALLDKIMSDTAEEVDHQSLNLDTKSSESSEDPVLGLLSSAMTDEEKMISTNRTEATDDNTSNGITTNYSKKTEDNTSNGIRTNLTRSSTYNSHMEAGGEEIDDIGRSGNADLDMSPPESSKEEQKSEVPPNSVNENESVSIKESYNETSFDGRESFNDERSQESIDEIIERPSMRALSHSKSIGENSHRSSSKVSFSRNIHENRSSTSSKLDRIQPNNSIGGSHHHLDQEEAVEQTADDNTEEDYLPEYSVRRTIATKVLGARMLQGYALREVLCEKCEMPLMALMGLERSAHCVVCPVLKKRAARERAEQEEAEKIRLQKQRIEHEATLQRDKGQTRATGTTSVPEPMTSQPEPSSSGLQAFHITPGIEYVAMDQSKRPTQNQAFSDGSDHESAQRSIIESATQLSYHSSVVDPIDCTQTVAEHTSMSLDNLQEIGSLIANENTDLLGSTSTENARTQMIKAELIKKLQEEAAAIRKEAEDAMNRAREALAHVENAKREILAISNHSSSSYEEEASSVPKKESDQTSLEESTDGRKKEAANSEDTAPSSHENNDKKKEEPKPKGGLSGGDKDSMKKDSSTASVTSPSTEKETEKEDTPVLQDATSPFSESNKKTEEHLTSPMSSPCAGIKDNKTKEDPLVHSASPSGREDDKMKTPMVGGKDDTKKEESRDLELWEQLHLDSKLVRSRRLLTGWKEVTDKCRGKECNGAFLLYNGEIEECIVCGGSGSGKDGIYSQLSDSGGDMCTPKKAKTNGKVTSPKSAGRKKVHSGDDEKHPTKLADDKLKKKKKTPEQARQKRHPGEIPSFRMSPRNHGFRTPDTSSQTARRTMEELEADFSVKRSIVSKEIGKRMLKGWTLLDMACPYCVMPLMVDSKGAKICCVLCGPIRQPLGDSSTQASQQASADESRRGSEPSQKSQSRIADKIDKAEVSVDNRSLATRSSEKSKTRFVLPETAGARPIAASRSNAQPAPSSPRRSCLRSPSSTRSSSSPKNNTKSDTFAKTSEKSSAKVSLVDDKKATSKMQRENKRMPQEESRKNIERVRPAPLQLTPAPHSHPGDEVPKTVVLVHGSASKGEDVKSPGASSHFLISRVRDASRRLNIREKADPPPVAETMYSDKNKGIEPDEEIDGVLHGHQPASKPLESDISSISKSEGDEEATKASEQSKEGEKESSSEAKTKDDNSFTSLADSIKKAKKQRDAKEAATPSSKHQNDVLEPVEKNKLDPETIETVNTDHQLDEDNVVRTKSHQLDAPEIRPDEAFETKILLLEDDDDTAPDKVLTLEVPIDFDVTNKESIRQLLIAAKAPSPSLDVDTTVIAARRCHPSPGMEAAPTPLPLASPGSSTSSEEKSRSSRPRVTPESYQRRRSTHRVISSKDSDVSTMCDSAVLVEKPNLVKKYAFPRSTPPVPTMVRTKRSGKKKKKENKNPTPAAEEISPAQNSSDPVVSEISDEKGSSPVTGAQVDSELVSEVSGGGSVTTASFHDLLERISEEKTKLENESKGVEESGKSKSRLHEVIQKLAKAAEEMNEVEG